MAIKADFTLHLKPPSVIMKEVMVPIATRYIRSAKEVVGRAAKNHPYKDQTGNNTKRIGFAVSAYGQSSFGSLETHGAGPTDAQGSGVTAKPDDLTVIVATSSSYGGWLEIGTRKMQPFPYIRPAWEIEKPKLLASLKGIV